MYIYIYIYIHIHIYIYIYMYTCTSVHKNIYNSEQTKTKLAPKSTIMFFFTLHHLCS